MKRPLVAIVAVAFAIGAASLSTPFLIAVIRHPFSQDTPIWLTLSIAAILASALAIWTYVASASLGVKGLTLRALLCIAFAFPAALLLVAFSINPP